MLLKQEKEREAAAKEQTWNLDYTTHLFPNQSATAEADAIRLGPGDGSNRDIDIVDISFLDGLDSDMDDDAIIELPKEGTPGEWQVYGERTQEQAKKRLEKQGKRKTIVATSREVFGKFNKLQTSRIEGKKAGAPAGK